MWSFHFRNIGLEPILKKEALGSITTVQSRMKLEKNPVVANPVVKIIDIFTF